MSGASPMPLALVALIAAMFGSSCGNRVEPEPADQAPVGMAGEAVTRIQGAELADAPGQTTTEPEPTPALPANFTPEDEIVFTDPDDPQQSLPELSSILSDPLVRRGPWEKSISIAKRRSMREGKPLLIWFTDSRTSPMCKAMNEELFTLPKFVEWANDNLIRLRVDEGEEIDDADLTLGEKETMRSELRSYVRRLKQQYKVLGYPSLVLLSPSGATKGHYRGYSRGDAEYTWGLIRQGVVASLHADKNWRAALEAKGYRQWHDNRGRSVFAKLTSYRSGVLTLIEPDGTRSKTHESKLSRDDRAWIAEQMRRRAR